MQRGAMQWTSRNIDWSLMAILDKAVLGDNPVAEAAQKVIAGGAGVLQLRDKESPSNEFYRDALAVRAIARAHGVPLIINDRVDIAMAAQADGVHLGQTDLPFHVARALLGTERLIGYSVHTLDEYQAAAAQEPDYFGVGTIFSSPTKPGLDVTGPELISALRTKTAKPLIAIGGITLQNAETVIRHGADGVAVISALFETDDLKQQTHHFVTQVRAVKPHSNDETSTS